MPNNIFGANTPGLQQVYGDPNVSYSFTPQTPLDLNKAINSGGLQYDSGSVLETNTTSGSPTNNQVVQQTQQDGPNPGDILSSGYNSYFSELDQMLNEGLPQERSNQENIANTNYQANVGELGNQLEQGNQNLNQTQTKSLRDIGGNISNLFRAGNIFLGSMGAGDSSAANQYSYALTKLGSQQRGQVMSDISNKKFQLNNIYNSEKNKMKLDFDNKIAEISSWFSEQQMALRGQRADAAKEYSNQVLTIAVNQLNAAQQQMINRKSALESWAMYNSNNIASLASNMSAVSQYTAPQKIQNPFANVSNQTVNPAQYYGGGSYSSDTTKKTSSLFPSYYNG